MQTKLFEIRDSGTFIPVLAVLARSGQDHEAYLLKRSGFGQDPDSPFLVMLSKLCCGEPLHYDPINWTHGRTLGIAHRFIEDHWHQLRSGDVVDVEYILCETPAPKLSERVDYP